MSSESRAAVVENPAEMDAIAFELRPAPDFRGNRELRLVIPANAAGDRLIAAIARVLDENWLADPSLADDGTRV
jgi:hypothetical protein